MYMVPTTWQAVKLPRAKAMGLTRVCPASLGYASKAGGVHARCQTKLHKQR